MTKINYAVAFVLLGGVLLGCSHLAEIPKQLWGSSTKRLEEERVYAMREVFSCSVDQCFDAIVRLAQDEGAASVNKLDEMPEEGAVVERVSSKKYFEIFIKDREKGMFVVMGVPGNVDTTEVGIFLVPVDGGQTRIEISSLSSSAKRKVFEILAQNLYDELSGLPDASNGGQ